MKERIINMEGTIYKCPCCDHRTVATEDQVEIFGCNECGHHDWEKVGQQIEFEQFYYIDTGELVHVSKLTRGQKVKVGLPVSERRG